MAFALPLVSPNVIAPVPEPPKALALVRPRTVPALIVKPPVNVLAPERVRVAVALLEPLITKPPEPSITPLSVRVWPAVSIWKTPVPPAAIVNLLELEAVEPV